MLTFHGWHLMFRHRKDKGIRKPTDEFFGIWTKFLLDIQTALKASDPHILRPMLGSRDCMNELLIYTDALSAFPDKIISKGGWRVSFECPFLFCFLVFSLCFEASEEQALKEKRKNSMPRRISMAVKDGWYLSDNISVMYINEACNGATDVHESFHVFKYRIPLHTHTHAHTYKKHAHDWVGWVTFSIAYPMWRN